MADATVEDEQRSADALEAQQISEGADVNRFHDEATQHSGERKLLSGRVVKYIGNDDKRSISSAEWDMVNSKTEDSVWSRANGFAIDESHFDDVALEYFAHDPLFVVATYDVEKVK